MLIIESEEQAWAALRRALDGDIDPEEIGVVDFRGWPNVRVHLPATPVNASITPSMMEAFIELQRSVYRAYTLIASDTADLRTLSREERDRLEFRVVVSDGSSDYLAPLADAAEKIGVEAVTRMPPEYTLTSILAIALIIGGSSWFKTWMSGKIETRRMELDDANAQRWLTAQQEAIHAGVEHAQLLARAMERAPVVADVEAFTDAARSSIVKSVGEEGGGSIFDVGISRELAQEISTQRRQSGEAVRLAGNYRVLRIDTNTPEGFRATLADAQTGEEIVAMLQDALLSEEHRAIIQRAEWSKQPFFAEITARRLRARIVDAIIVSAREAEAVRRG